LTENTVIGNGEFGFFVSSSGNTFIENEGCNNAFSDAVDVAGGNTWADNNFCTSFGI
jgi:parallel beta-helix repeat protein